MKVVDVTAEFDCADGQCRVRAAPMSGVNAEVDERDRGRGDSLRGESASTIFVSRSTEVQGV